MATTSKNTKQDSIIEHQAQIELTEQQVDDRLEAIEKAEAHLDDLKARLAGGDESVTVQHLTEAQTGVERAQILHQGTVAKVERLKAEAPFIPIVADAMSDALAEELAVPVKVVDEFPENPGKNLPVLYLVQPGAAEPDRHPRPYGSMTGQVRARFHRPAYMRAAITAKDIESALAGVQGTYRAGRVATNGQVDTFTIDGQGVWPELPKVPGKPHAHVVKGFAANLAHSVRASTKDTETRVLPSMTDSGYSWVDVYGVGVEVVDASVTAYTVDEGVATTTIRVSFDAWVSQGFEHRIPSASVKELAESAVRRLDGKAFAYVGRVTAAELTRKTMNVGAVKMQANHGGFFKRDRGAASVYVATFTFKAAA
ncbi:hypothetical protein [Isoptericola haloaureus]|uniref:HK97 family phage major capsid protein n=1 Tax=Isoptericola haloaureus TaxID=1542902 RepID=A0ABU7Z8J1_9MICO